jgi:hypothetical protein
MVIIRRRLTATPAPATPTAVIRRTRPAPSVATPTAPGRLHRVTSKNTAHTRAASANAARERINVLLQSIANHEDIIDNTLAEMERANGEIEQLMRANNISMHSDGHYVSEIYEAVSRQSRTIDPKKFRNAVGDAAFWGSIEVGVTKAKKHMSEKELDAISDVVPPQSQGFKYRIKKVERKIG